MDDDFKLVHVPVPVDTHGSARAFGRTLLWRTLVQDNAPLFELELMGKVTSHVLVVLLAVYCAGLC